MNNDECVLVTGGTGFIAGHSIVQALNAGWRVRTTVRDLAREPALRAVIGDHAPIEPLEVVAADLNADTGWLEAATGCTYVLHIASPFPSVSPKNDAELVQPARDGILRVLAAARGAGVRRVVMTSSTAAVAYGRGGRDNPFTEADWSDETNLSDTSGYERSKTIAERAAWTWMKREGHALELVTICPGAVLGPMLGSDRSASIDIVARLLNGSVPGLARFGWPLVDVRDVAALHLSAMTDPAAAGQRYLAAGDFAWMSDVAGVLRERVPLLATRVPRRSLPSPLVRASGLSTVPCVAGCTSSANTERSPLKRHAANSAGRRDPTRTRSSQPPRAWPRLVRWAPSSGPMSRPASHIAQHSRAVSGLEAERLLRLASRSRPGSV